MMRMYPAFTESLNATTKARQRNSGCDALTQSGRECNKPHTHLHTFTHSKEASGHR
jgi:hypothetical protein